MTLKEHIDDIRDNLEKGVFINEAAVCDYIVRRLLVYALEWPRHSPKAVIREYGVEGTRVDFALCDPPLKPRVFIEVKKVGNIEGGEKQLFQYAFHEGVPIAILTDGQKWQFFYPMAEGDYRERKVYEMDLTEGDSEEHAKWLSRYLNYGAICTGDAVEAIKKDYEKVVQQRQVATRLPEAWGKLVEEADEFLLDVVAEKVESLCGYKPTDEQVLDFLKSLKREIKPDIGEEDRSHPGLFFTMPNGEQINHKTSAVTFVEVIEKLGIERVKNLKKKYLIPIISTSKHHKYGQTKSGRYYITTHSSTQTKKRLLKEIASELREPLKVEIIPKL